MQICDSPFLYSAIEKQASAIAQAFVLVNVIKNRGAL